MQFDLIIIPQHDKTLFEVSMTTPATYRSVARDLIAAIEKEYPDLAKSGALSEVYKRAKELVTDEATPTLFVSVTEAGAYDASISNYGLSDIAVVVMDETLKDESGLRMTVEHVDGSSYQAAVKMLVPTEAHFDAEAVVKNAVDRSFANGSPTVSGIERAIQEFVEWKSETAGFNGKLVGKVNDAICENGFALYSDYLVDTYGDFKAALLAKAEEFDPSSDYDHNDAFLSAWLERDFSASDTSNVVIAAIYEKGTDSVSDLLDREPENAPSI